MQEKEESNKRKRDDLIVVGSDRAVVEEECKGKEPCTSKECHNPRFENYYRLQEICGEDEFRELIASLSTPLPTSLRVNLSHPLNLLFEFALNLASDKLLKEAKEYSGQPPVKEKILSESCRSHLLSHCSREMLKSQPHLTNLHSLIVSQDEFGVISRQEIVSMLPCISLDVQPGHSVLDMCSAPGSKSTQILDEILSSRENLLGIGLQKGVFICNDANPKRLDTLSSRISRIPSPNVLITCIDASFFPTFRSNQDNDVPIFQFDRILVDSPCSGDGTLRKNPDIWVSWRPEKALNLYKKQISLLSRAFRLLKSGGRLVYSTCSLNPIENEAVVSTILRQFPQARLVEHPSINSTQLCISKGLRSWKVYCDLKNQNELQLFDDFETIPETPFKEKLTRDMFPSKEWAESGSFNKCFRVLPHKNDTGGFFFAVIQKEGVCQASNSDRGGAKLSSPKYEEVEMGDFELISEFYGLVPYDKADSAVHLHSLPTQIGSHLESVGFLRRSSLIKRNSCGKTIYLIGEDVSRLIQDYNLEVDLRSVGTRAFEYLKGGISGNGRCRWRIHQSCSNYLVRLMRRRLIFVSVSLLDLLDQERGFLGSEVVRDLEKKGELIGLREFCSTLSGEDRLESGGVLVVITPPSILKYSGDNEVNPRFQELHQGIPLSGILYEDSGISLFISKNEIKSIKQLVLI
ncbi:putative RNA methylase [Cryptosporidium canis]|uniref:RNA methylase n=1 Tax=Cryptosporidium canis TaxID=195482 RepID=A0A9D5HW08_9CRYT|nr:putative RNA methylase [Cryptosporidium canis]